MGRFAVELIIIFFIVFYGSFSWALFQKTPELAKLEISVQPVAPGDFLEISVEFSTPIEKATVVFGPDTKDKIALTCVECGRFWAGRYQIPPGLKEGQNHFKIFWFFKAPKKITPFKYKIVDYTIAESSGKPSPADENNSAPISQEESLSGFSWSKKSLTEGTAEQTESTQTLIALLEKSLGYNPQNLTALRKLAQLYRQDKQFSKALEALEKIVAGEPNFYDYLELNDLYLKTNSFKRGEKFYQSLLEKQPGNTFCQTGLGFLLLNFKSYLPGYQLFKKICKNEPANSMSLLGRGESALKLRRFREAQKDFLKAGQLSPASPYPDFFLSNFYWVGRNYELAEKFLKSAEEKRFPKGIFLYLAWARIFEKTKQASLAQEYYQKVLKADPGNKEAASKLKNN